MTRRQSTELRTALDAAIRGAADGSIIVRRQTRAADRYGDALLQLVREGAAGARIERLHDPVTGAARFMYGRSAYGGDDGYGT